MFKSFFPNPRWFFLSFIVWSLSCAAIWLNFQDALANFAGLDISEKEPVIGLGHFLTDKFILFYFYYAAATALFTLFWITISPHKWQWWSILGSALILFSTYFSVQLSVALNNWRRPFYDMIQDALTPEKDVSVEALGSLAFVFVEIASVFIIVYVLTHFFANHYIFRWRSAMNDHYTSMWDKVRHIEGASQRVQEDTMRFSLTVERLGVQLIDAIMTLFAFLPVLWGLSQYVETLPIVGKIAAPLVVASLLWSIFGTALLALVGIKLPGLEFRNQRVEAAYRKELVYGEDDPERAEPLKLKELFGAVRRNYFRLYFHYLYFNIARSLYLQTDNIFPTLILIPTIAAGKITFGIFQQIVSAFNQVSSSFQYLVTSWSVIVELMSVYKRLSTFERAAEGKPVKEHYAFD